MAEKLAPEVEVEIVKAYRAGSGGRVLMQRFGVGLTTVYRVLRRNRVKRRPRSHRLTKFSDAQRKRMARMYADGVLPSKIAEEMDCSTWAVRDAVRRYGGGRLRRGGQLRPWTKRQRATIVRRYEAGQSQAAIAPHFGTSQITISRVLREEGVRTGRRPHGHGNWNGGRVRMGSYVAVMVEPDSPFASMRMSQGYVLEHRLVMAKKLGRPLTSRESVHHINGVRDDNRPENLQLRRGKHGTGQVLACADCGSRNVVHVGLG